MWQFLHRWTSNPYFYRYTEKLAPWLTSIFLITLAYGLFGGLYLAPADFQQGDGFRIIYVHVPAAFMSLALYTFMTFLALTAYVWKIKLADILIKSTAPVGAWFTVIALITGSLWGKPMWGTYWVWDARLTSELILLFIYLGIIGLQNAIPIRESAARLVQLLVMVGFVNIPIIHFSVQWWNTLHQGSTIKFSGPSLIAPSMQYPLMAMLLAFALFSVIVITLRARVEIVIREANASWLREQLN